MTNLTQAELLAEIETLRQRVTTLETTLAKSQDAHYAAEHRFQMLYNLSNSFIMAHDDEYNVVYMNPYACNELGYTQEELIGSDIRNLLEETEYERANPVREKINIDPQLHIEGFEQYYLRRNGERVLINWNVSALKDKEDNPIGIVGVGQNLTAQRKTEDELARHRQEFETKVDERTQALQQREQQLHQTIQELSTPIIPVMDGIIVLPLIGTIDSMRAQDLMRTMLRGISQHRAKIAILDITGVGIIDTGIAAYLDKIIHAARLKGARTIITGISDAVAETIIDLGIDWGKVETLRDLQTGLMVALQSLGVTLSR